MRSSPRDELGVRGDGAVAASRCRAGPVWGIGLLALVVVVALSGLLLIDRKSLDEESRRLVPAALDRVEAALPPGSTLIDKATRVTSTNHKTLGRMVFVSPVPGREAVAALVSRLGWSDCGDGTLRSIPCAAPKEPETLVARVQAAAVGAGGRDTDRYFLGRRAGDFPPGTVVVEVLVNTE